ncbi:MAG: hypothetical protein ACK5HR_04480, partial [Mycoplasmatales bacterium]
IFTVKITSDIADKLVDNDQITNKANVCYDNTYTEDVTDDQTCVSTGVSTPYTLNPETLIPDENNFTIDKWIEDTDDDKLQPGEKLIMHIYITNNKNNVNQFEANGDTLTVNITDDMLDSKIDYVNALNNSVTITNLTTGEDVTSEKGNPKVSDLEDTKGIELNIEDGEEFELTFEVNANSAF